MALVKVNNGDSGLDARNKINAAFDKADLNETDIASIINGTASLAELNVSGDLVVSGTASLNDVVIADGKKIKGASDTLTLQVHSEVFTFGVGENAVLAVEFSSGLELDPQFLENGTQLFAFGDFEQLVSQVQMDPQFLSISSNFIEIVTPFGGEYELGFIDILATGGISLFASDLTELQGEIIVGNSAGIVISTNQLNIDGNGENSIQLFGETGDSSIEMKADNLVFKPTSDIFKIQALATFADNDDAIAGGLTEFCVYKTATGEVRIVV